MTLLCRGDLSALCFHRCPGTPHSPASFQTGCSLCSKASLQPRTFLQCPGRLPVTSLCRDAWVLRSQGQHSVTPSGCVITPPSLPPAVYTYDSRDEIGRGFSMGATWPRKAKNCFGRTGSLKKPYFLKYKTHI